MRGSQKFFMIFLLSKGKKFQISISSIFYRLIGNLNFKTVFLFSFQFSKRKQETGNQRSAMCLSITNLSIIHYPSYVNIFLLLLFANAKIYITMVQWLSINEFLWSKV